MQKSNPALTSSRASSVTHRRTLPWCLVLLLSTGCTSFTGGGASEQVGVAELRDEINALRRQAAVAEVEMANLKRRILELEGRLGGAPSGSPAPQREPTPAPAVPSIAESEAPTAVTPPPRIEESELPAEPIEAEPPPAAEDRNSGWQEAPPTDPPARPVVEVTEPILSPVEEAARVIYDRGYTHYHEGDFAAAERDFLEFLALGPANELSDNALFWVGSSRYARGDYPGALRAFRETVETYPDQNKVPDALFKIGQCLEQVGDRANAEEVFRELVQRFPETAAATLAQQRLDNP